jgi:hypothetical protein
MGKNAKEPPSNAIFSFLAGIEQSPLSFLLARACAAPAISFGGTATVLSCFKAGIIMGF